MFIAFFSSNPYTTILKCSSTSILENWSSWCWWLCMCHFISSTVGSNFSLIHWCQTLKFASASDVYWIKWTVLSAYPVAAFYQLPRQLQRKMNVGLQKLKRSSNHQTTEHPLRYIQFVGRWKYAKGALTVAFQAVCCQYRRFTTQTLLA